MTNLELTEKAKENGYIIELSEGIYVFTPKMAKLINDIKDTLINGVAKKLDFSEWIFPRIIPEKKLKATGWLKYHPNQAFLVHSLPNSTLLDDRYMLDPIQCISLYTLLFDTFAEDIGAGACTPPIKAYEVAGGWTYRNEDHLDGLFKSKSFLRVEFVYIASYQETITIRNEILDNSIKSLKDKFNLDITKAKGDSCFIESPTHDGTEKYKIIGDDVGPLTPSIDVIYKRNDEYLELASGTIAHDVIVERFKIKSRTIPDDLSSGCFGFGLNRIALAVLEKTNFTY